jgi:hypothetical protein
MKQNILRFKRCLPGLPKHILFEEKDFRKALHFLKACSNSASELKARKKVEIIQIQDI